MRTLLMLLLAYHAAFAQSASIRYRNTDQAIVAMATGACSGAPGCTIVAVSPAQIQILAGEMWGQDVPQHAWIGATIINRRAEAIAAERMLIARNAAIQNLIQARLALTAIKQLSISMPGSPLQAQLSAASSAVTSYASQAGLPATTATTQ